MTERGDSSSDSTGGLFLLMIAILGLVAATVLLFGQILYVEPANGTMLITLPIIVGIMKRIGKSTNEIYRNGPLK